MATPLMQIGGLASGLDTTAIVDQLMQIERVPVRAVQRRQDELRAVDDAWGKVNTKLSAVRGALDALGGARGVDRLRTATSSAPEALAVAVPDGATPATGTYAFRVEQLANAHQAAASFASADALVGAGTLTIDVGGEQVSVTADDTTTVADLARLVNGADGDVSAQVVAVGSGDVRLLLSSGATGLAGAMTVAERPAGVGAFEDVQAAQDARIAFGSGAGGFTVTRSTNVIDDLVAGATLTLTEADPARTVTVTVDRDVDATVDRVKKLVTALDDAMGTLKDLSGYDAETKVAGPLQGESAVRRLREELRSAATALSGVATGVDLGVEVDRYGAVTLDESRLRTALAEDFAGVVGALETTTDVTDPSVSRVTTGAGTRSGSYAVEVTQAAWVAVATGTTYSPPVGEPKTFTITMDDGKEVAVTVEVGDDVDAAVSKINAALATARIGSLTAEAVQTGTDEHGQPEHGLRLTESRYGSAASFTLTGAGSLGLADGEHTGTDVSGTFTDADGTVLAATGTGRTLTGTDGGATDLAVTLAAGATGSLGQVTVGVGITHRLDQVLERAEGVGGLVDRARNSLNTEIRRFDDRIADFELRLASREQTLRRQFTALETALARTQSQGQWLSGALAGVYAGMGGG